MSGKILKRALALCLCMLLLAGSCLAEDSLENFVPDALTEEELAQSLGRGVKIVAGRKKGRIELDYYDMDDLNDLLDALGTLQQRKNGGTKK